MSPSMTRLAEIIHRDLKKRLENDNTVSVEPFNHVTILMYYQKSLDEKKKSQEEIAGIPHGQCVFHKRLVCKQQKQSKRKDCYCHIDVGQ
mmetsp:Transcript_7236/g.13280  ORF Transcript_7236/g.13280 Transcript_7236/m.13280 type:complete len:90 (-) Transcript_7236:345-614(-)